MDIRSLVSQIPMEPGYVPAPPQPDLTTIQRLLSIPQVARAVGQNLAVGAASLPYGIYKGFGDPAAGEAAMSQFQQEYGYVPTDPAAQRQLQGLGEFLQQLETEYKIPPIMAPVAATPALGIRGLTPQGQNLARDLVREIQTTPPTGAVTMAPSSVPKSDLGFYSQLEAAVQPLQNKGTGQQYLAQIQKSAGVKPEEIQWTGLDTFLQGRQSVTKQEIQDYLNANRVDVREVRLDRTPAMVGAERNAAYDAYDRGEITLEQRNEILERSDPTNTRHHLGAYQGIKTEIPGGENYREILLTLPTQDQRIASTIGKARLTPEESDRYRELETLARRGEANQTQIDELGRLEQRVSESQAAFASARQQDAQRDFVSTHFDQPNILAHLRVNDRTVDGKKTLFVEEIQSDWHQAGRKKGYKSEIDPNENASLVKQYDSLTAKRRQIEEIVATGDDASPVTQNAIQNLNQINAELQRISDRLSEIRTAAKEGVPDAPFKTSWHELSLKRAIQEAAEKGYDQIAFTTGKTQAERYDLSKQVDSIVYAKENDGTYSLVAIKDGRELVKRDSVAQSALPDLVGKEVAERMAASEGKAIPGGPERELSGENLRVGGEGMKGFYDNILPKSLDKLGKKFGAKVGKTFIEGERTRDADGFPSMYPEKIEVWQMDITPQMRESVTTKGQPLFAIPAIGAGLLGAGMMQEEEQF